MNLYLKKGLSKIRYQLRLFYRIYLKRDIVTINAQKWFKEKGDDHLRLNYPLHGESVVFDIGGYLGNWSQKIVEKYNPYIFIFEPVPKYYTEIINKFKTNSKARCYNFGLSNKNEDIQIAINEDRSSVFTKGKDLVNIYLKDIYEFLIDQGVDRIDLIKINIEGGEYPLLDRMIEKNIIEKCRNIQIQFHTFYPNAKQRREIIRNALQKTHYTTYDYPFVWENWGKK